MNLTTTPRRVNRRTLLTAAGLGAVSVGAGATLSGCSGATAPPPAEQGAPIAEGVLPKYVPVDYVQPDIPSKNGSPPGYTKMPAELVRSVPAPLLLPFLFHIPDVCDGPTKGTTGVAS
jgi:putative aldouronate transport system substrate-binding protein